MSIAPFVPLWGILAFFGTEQLRGTPYMLPFAFAMALIILGLFVYVANQALRAKRARSGTLKERSR
jgi:hypothetical protein